MGKFRTKRINVDALMFIDEPEELVNIQELLGGEELNIDYSDENNPILNVTHGDYEYQFALGDYIIKNPDGTITRKNPDDFERIFESEESMNNPQIPQPIQMISIDTHNKITRVINKVPESVSENENPDVQQIKDLAPIIFKQKNDNKIYFGVFHEDNETIEAHYPGRIPFDIDVDNIEYIKSWNEYEDFLNSPVIMMNQPLDEESLQEFYEEFSKPNGSIVPLANATPEGLKGIKETIEEWKKSPLKLFFDLSDINQSIKNLPENHREQVSDGYHTFKELYDHRIRLWITLCKFYHGFFTPEFNPVWITTVHSDGSSWDGWFLLGVGKEKGQQITYHLPNSYWVECSKFATIIDKAPKFDGHTSADVLERLKGLI